MDDTEKLLSIQNAASLVGVNAGTLRRWAQNNKVQAFKVGTRGDWKFKKEDLQKLVKKNRSSKISTHKFKDIKKFLRDNANSIQKLATEYHKKFLQNKEFRTEYLHKYQKYHIEIVKDIANNLKTADLKRGTILFKKRGEVFAKEAIEDGLTIEETVDGIIFLKQAVWESLKNAGMLKDFFVEEMYDINIIIGTYCDVLASKIAFTFHEYRKKQIEKERNRLYSLLMQAPVPIAIVKGPDHVYELSNHLNNLGMGKEVQIGVPVKKQFPEVAAQGLIALLDKVYKSGKPYQGKEASITVNVPGKGPETKYINFTYQPLKISGNKVEGVMVIANDVTDQVTARKKIQGSEERFRSAFTYARVGVSITDPKGNYMYINPAYEKITGYTKKELFSRGFQSILHPDDYKENMKKISEMLSGKIPGFIIENRYIRKDNTPIWVRKSVSAIRDSNKIVQHMVGLVEDITDRKKAEEALKESEQRFRALTNASSDVIYRMSPDWKEMRQLEGRGFLADTGKPIRNWLQKYIHPKDRKDVLEKIDNAIRTKSVFELEHQVMQADGSLGWTFSRAIPILDNKGKLIEWFGAASDITERKRAEDAVKESEERFRTLADNIPNLVWMANAEGYIYWYNSRWYEYTGTTPKQMEGWGWKTVHDPKILPVVMERWKYSLSKGTVFEMVFPLRGADGVFRPFLTRVVPISDEKGRVILWFGTNTDITKQKELEKQKDEFLGIASHELKTPVTSLKAYGQVLEKMFQKKGDIRSVEMLAKMGTQIDKLTNLIEDLLDVTKIQSGRLEFHERHFDFNELVGEKVEELQRTTERHKIITKLSITKTVYGDPDRIGQVISNLISNAIKYSPNADKIFVKTEVEDRTITLCVQDFGIGIPKKNQEKVFEQFFRVSGDQELTFPGLGLGLYVSREIIKREGGEIWVNSTKGKGSVFCFSLPLSKKPLKRKR